MAYKSLQQCLNDLEKNGRLVRISEEVGPNLEMAEIQRRVFATGGPAGWYYSAYPAHSEKMDAYNSAKDIFESSQTVDNALTVNEAVKKTDDSYKKGMTALYLLGGVYTITLLDAMLFSYKTEKTYSIKPYIKIYMANAFEQHILFGLILYW